MKEKPMHKRGQYLQKRAFGAQAIENANEMQLNEKYEKFRQCTKSGHVCTNFGHPASVPN